jgi:hypothetical protein
MLALISVCAGCSRQTVLPRLQTVCAEDEIHVRKLRTLRSGYFRTRLSGASVRRPPGSCARPAFWRRATGLSDRAV